MSSHRVRQVPKLFKQITLKVTSKTNNSLKQLLTHHRETLILRTHALMLRTFFWLQHILDTWVADGTHQTSTSHH